MSSTEKKLVSVIVPVYKVEEYLPECLDSILAQTYRNFELILVDDGSPDRCGEICDEYAALDNRIKVIHQDNQGVSAARNVGMEAANGCYISFVDSDDTIASDFISYLVDLIELDSETDLAVCGIKRNRRSSAEQNHPPITEKNGTALSRLLSSKYFGVFAWNKLYSKRALSGIQYPVGVRFEDVAVIASILANCREVAFGFKQLYLYRNDRNDSFMNTYSRKPQYDKKRFLDTMQQVIARSMPDAMPAFHLYAARSCRTMLDSLSKSQVIVSIRREDESMFRCWLREYLACASKSNRLSITEKVSFVLWLNIGLNVNRVLRDTLGFLVR